MTQLESELLRSFWPYLWTAIMASVSWFLKTQNQRMEAMKIDLHKLCEARESLEKQMIEDRAATRHRIDRLIGDCDARITRIEAICDSSTCKSGNPPRRSGDTKPVHWAHDSDVFGGK